MSKRIIAKLSGGEEVEAASRHKRRKETRGTSSDVEAGMSDRELSREEVKEMGMQIWQTVKDAVKDGEAIAIPFLRKPSSKLYPDYYLLIKNPIALDDIKKRLNEGRYPSLEDVRSDFELLFGNAKQYNQTESAIYQHAKDLLKLVHKTYNKLVPNDDENEMSKPPSLFKLLKARLEKLVSKKDPNDGRVLSTEFMQLPSRKLWPIYYVEIQKPECFDNIHKRLKHKVYQSVAEFAADVELIFSNAMAFNQDGTQIFIDAVTLRDHFRLLMSDLPPPFSLPEYTKPVNKIRIRPVLASQTSTTALPRPAGKQEQLATSLTLKVPAPQAPINQTASSAMQPQTQASPPPPTPNTSTLPVARVVAQRPPPKAVSQFQPAVKAATPQPPAPAPSVAAVSFIKAAPSHYPRPQSPHVAPLPGPSVIPPVAATPPLPAGPTVNTTQSESQIAAPQVVYPPNRQIKSVGVLVQPRSRRLTLDHRDGVKTWSVRLVPGETSLLVNEVAYMEEDDDEGSENEYMDADKDDDDSMDVDHVASPPRKKGKGRGRGRPPKAAKVAQLASAAKAAKTTKKKVSRKLGEVQLKLNNFVVTDQPEKPGEWSVYLVTGTNVIEVGEVGGMTWKLYAERIVDA